MQGREGDLEFAPYMGIVTNLLDVQFQSVL